MEDGECRAAAFSPLCVKMSPLIQQPTPHLHPTPPYSSLPQPSLCLLSLFVSEMIPSVMSKATLSYSCCLGNQCAERQRLKTSAVFEAGKHERLAAVQPRVGFPAYQNGSPFAGMLGSIGLIIISSFFLSTHESHAV